MAAARDPRARGASDVLAWPALYLPPTAPGMPQEYLEAKRALLERMRWMVEGRSVRATLKERGIPRSRFLRQVDIACLEIAREVMKLGRQNGA